MLSTPKGTATGPTCVCVHSGWIKTWKQPGHPSTVGTVPHPAVCMSSPETHRYWQHNKEIDWQCPSSKIKPAKSAKATCLQY